MGLRVITPPSGYPVTLDEIKTWCNIHAGNQDRAPDAPTAALAGAGAGNVENGAHRYLVTFVTAVGETSAGTPSAAVTVVDKTVNGKVALTAIPVGGLAVTSRKLYRTAAAGSTYLLLVTIADNTTTVYTDNIADASLGAGAPSTNTTGDPLLTLLAASATAHAEVHTRRALLTQTLEESFDRFPGWVMTLSKSRLQSVVSIKYTDTNGVEQTMDPSTYHVDAVSEPPRITPEFGLIWPYSRWELNAVRVRYVAGYGAAVDVPAVIKHWMQLRLSTMEINRESLLIDARAALVEMPEEFVDGLLNSERVDGFEWANDAA